MKTIRKLALVTFLTFFIGAAANAQDNTQHDALMLHLSAQNAMADKLQASVFRVHIATKQGAEFSSKNLHFDGACVVVKAKEGIRCLSTLDWLHGASRIEIEVDGNKKEMAHITRQDDLQNLVLLETPTLSNAKPIPLTDALPLATYAVILLPGVLQRLVSGSLHIEDERSYASSSLQLSNGYPLFNAEGALVALSVRYRVERQKADAVHYHLIRAFLNPSEEIHIETEDFVHYTE